MNDLQQRSIEIILAGQFDGAYAACLSFSQYGYCWLRDGTWIAHGMDAAGQTQSARAFHRWVGRTLTRYSDKVTHILNLLAAGKQPAESDYLPTRFGLDGSIGLEDWGDFQMDGYGTWLWGLAQFVNKHGDDDLWQEARPATELVINYLAALWDSPNYDCWEEHREHIHPATLAAIYGGMKAVQVFLPELVTPTLLEAMCSFTLTNGVASDGHFMKYLGNEAVDASLLWIGTPYRLVDIHDVHFLATLAKIEQDLLRPQGGVYRYQNDTYYGGGEWLLLTLWLAWVYIELGKIDQARELVAWVESQASPSGELAEQVSGHQLAPAYYDEWVERWGTPATPLLWSHGMYLLVKSLLEAR